MPPGNAQCLRREASLYVEMSASQEDTKSSSVTVHSRYRCVVFHVVLNIQDFKRLKIKFLTAENITRFLSETFAAEVDRSGIVRFSSVNRQ